MSVKIRLSRGGAKKRPFYRVVVADVRERRDGRFIERIGTYNPMLPKDDENRLQIDLERVKYWMGHGALPTDRVAKFLEKAGVLPEKARNNPNKAKPGAKAQERLEEARMKAEEAAEKAAEAAAAPPAEEPAAAEEAEAAPTEEAEA